MKKLSVIALSISMALSMVSIPAHAEILERPAQAKAIDRPAQSATKSVTKHDVGEAAKKAQPKKNQPKAQSKAQPKTHITTQPKTLKVTEGSNANFSVKASGQKLKYQWQMQTAGRGAWKNISSSANATVSRTSTVQNNSNIKVTVTGAQGKATSQTVKLTVAKKVPATKITSQPTGASVVEGQSTSFKVKATGSNLYYEWQIKYPNNSTWYYFARGNNASTGNLTNIGYSENKAQIRVLVTGANGYAYSRNVPLTVRKAAKPTITSVSVPRSDYTKNITLKVNGKNFNDITKVHYYGDSSQGLSFKRSGNSLTVTIPSEKVPTTATIMVNSSSGSSQINVTRSKVLSAAQRTKYLNDYETQRRILGVPGGKPGAAMSKALSTIKAKNAWDDDAWDASLINGSGFKYRHGEIDLANQQKKLAAVNKDISKYPKKPKKGQKTKNQLLQERTTLTKQIDATKKTMNTNLANMRSLGAKV